MSEENKSFNYTYSAKDQAEMRKIREKYMPREEDKMELLRRLDASATQSASVVSLILGIVGTLIMGLGMSAAMVWEQFVLGIIVGIIGIAALALAYPVYVRMVKKARERIAPEIIRLTDELMK